MIVAIDAGNSEVKLALVRDGRVLSLRRAPSRSAAAAYDAEGLLAAALGSTSAGIPASATHAIEALVIVSVVPRWTEAFGELGARLAKPVLVADAAAIPLAVRLPQPDRVGADRLLNAYAAVRLHGAPAIVVDLGTATTVDAVDADGAFVGGAIAAGMALGLAALGSGTAQLPRVPLRAPERSIGRDTAEAMASGAVLGHIGLVRELCARMTAELGLDGGRAPIIVTGGLSAGPWASLLDMADAIDPELALKGLSLLHAELRAGVS